MAGKQGKSRPAQPKYKKAIKREFGGGAKSATASPGSAPDKSRANLGRTIEVKATPKNPGLGFVKARGSKHGDQVDPKMLVGPKASLMKKQASDKKKAGK